MSVARELVACGTVPCRTCGKAHDAYRVPDSGKWGSWASEEDGHPYSPMSAAEVVELYASHGFSLGAG